VDFRKELNMTKDKKVAGYRFGVYWLKKNAKNIAGMCDKNYKSETEMISDYDLAFGSAGSAGGLVRVYTDGSTFVLRAHQE
jgi:hypothetical protein